MFTEVLMFLRRPDGAAGGGSDGLDAGEGLGVTRPVVATETDRAGVMQESAAWQWKLDDDPDRHPGARVGPEPITQLREQLKALRESGGEQLSRSDSDARFLRARGGFVLGYTAEIAVSEDHFLVAQRVTQCKSANHALLPPPEEVQQQCGERPKRVWADCGFFALRMTSFFIWAGRNQTITVCKVGA